MQPTRNQSAGGSAGRKRGGHTSLFSQVQPQFLQVSNDFEEQLKKHASGGGRLGEERRA